MFTSSTACQETANGVTTIPVKSTGYIIQSDQVRVQAERDPRFNLLSVCPNVADIFQSKQQTEEHPHI